ncbi:hypothetical protein K5R88_08815 [Pseudomonas sp. MM213]|uniref:hypothetical protein n=1 Tax=Pseudomonas sp. MM213 TaxID=2866807 RepID=UPI001CF1707E|nr:hypothetical protein [Pseudomonas sp. MM213]UCP11700.1 hypothetical protein K5R88_08815 [Pseudomonas sp. MM213]
MSEIIEVEFHSKWLTDFQLGRLVRATNQRYIPTITAFISDAIIVNDTCLGVVFDHTRKDESGRHADCSIIQTAKIQSARKAGRFWILTTGEDHYVIASFKRGGGRRSFLELLRSGERTG